MKVYNVHIKNVKVDDKKVYWTVVDDWGDGHSYDYRTNADGEGIWKWDDRRGEWKQTVGTCQFALHQKTISGIRKALHRWFDAFDV